MTYRKINHAFIMAAGRGTRLMPLTKKIPKGLVKFKQTSLIARGVKRLKKYINFVHISVGYKGPILAKHLIEEKVSSIINTDTKGNSWWIFNSIFNSFDSPIYVLTCDNVTNIDFKKIEKDYFKKGQPLCMLIPTKPVKGLKGDYIFRKKNLISNLSRAKKSEIYCTGIQVLNPKRINKKITPTEDFNILLKKLIKIKQLYVSDVMPRKWYTVDDVENYKNLKKFFDK